MTIPETAGKVATSAVEALKGNPSCLAAILLAGIFALLTYMALQAQEQRMHERQMSMIARCFPLATDLTDTHDQR